VNDHRQAALLDRLATRSATSDDFRDLAAMAALDDGAWDRAAEALGAEAALERAVGERVAALADRVELPRRRGRLVAAAAAGWLAAAAAGVLAWAGRASPDVAPPAASAPPAVSGVELPRLLLEAIPLAGGTGIELVTLRRIVERTTVPSLFEIGVDEHGSPAVAPAVASRLKAPESL